MERRETIMNDADMKTQETMEALAAALDALQPTKTIAITALFNLAIILAQELGSPADVGDLLAMIANKYAGDHAGPDDGEQLH
jgi:hypothetical protein